MLPIYETFYAWQGEGCHAGRAAFFIRTFGCPLRCPWCDSAGTWHPDWVPDKIDRLTESELVARATETKAEFVVVTGGEPAIHDLTRLTHDLANARLPVHLETSGSFSLRGSFDWVTVSPKWAIPPLPDNLERADEIKLIVEASDSIERWWEKIARHVRSHTVWLHPEWSKRDDPEVLNAISKAVKEHGAPFRAGYQMHRLYNVDSLDSGSRVSVPLGGNPALGR